MEDRPRHKLETPFLRAPDLGAGQVGRQQVRSELHTCEVCLQPCRQGPDGRGLGQARCTLHQQVAIGQQGNQKTFDQRRLANDLGRQRIAQVAEGRMQARGDGGRRRGNGFGHRRRQVHGGL
ncbi:hypothetical protein D3C73_1159440 [compost metagenome]